MNQIYTELPPVHTIIHFVSVGASCASVSGPVFAAVMILLFLKTFTPDAGKPKNSTGLPADAVGQIGCNFLFTLWAY